MMRKMPILAAAAATLMAMMVESNAQSPLNPRSGVRQPDFSTCSSSREACLMGTARRGDSGAGCERAFKTCMRTGTWDTYGYYGRRLSGVERR